ncbi:MAG: hypothetical protein ABFD82_04700 [Syntrophaceae bacterium]
MNLRYRKYIYLIMLFIFVIICSCGPATSTVVMLNREKYDCKINPDQFIQLKGKRILLASIDDKSTTTSNLAYYNPERTVGYQLFYSSAHSMPQPVVSYFWYALQKGFECAGVKIEESGPVYDAELSLIFKSLTDEEINFQALLTKKGMLAFNKDFVVRMPKVETNEQAVLEQRAYRMLDSIVTTILSDPDFQKAFL